ncbi:hypothetical protein [Nannocystis radixulma]|uniref:Myxococcus cysteine-rich repeat-containing protein n=1 Tax=Nannocystis radixulma TaxID=2995305 RepID=A0ABT5BEP3_9BACT|nr:hypothetical protein [Nannocystis radixulma]MDC0672619.1 hypothetical protein [Nannocystis radixulma]
MVDPDEDCDLGAENSNSGACTMMCNPAVCGDSLLWVDHEECDFGPGNVGGFGGCNPDCTLAPHCGDGQVDPEHEECDLAALNGTGMSLGDDAPCGSSCRWVGRRFFVSSTQADGDLGGLAGADLYCRNLAVLAGLKSSGTFRAWLSDGVDSPATRFEQIDLAGAPLILLSGRIVAEDFAELFALGPRTGISLTETGQSLFEEPVWTNTSPLGEPFSAAEHCAGWTSASNQLKARVGVNALPLEMGPAWDTWRDERQWTTAITFTCEKVWRIYCVEDGVEPET